MRQLAGREIGALVLTLGVVISLVAVAQPTAAVSTSVSGPDEVKKPETITFTTAVSIQDGERIPVENYTVTIGVADSPDESVSITFAPNGSVSAVSPSSGVIGDGEIRIDRLLETIEVVPVERGGEFGYGYGYGVDERTGERSEFGYGYGYGGPATISFEITLDSNAFKQGNYDLRASVNTPERTGLYTSNVQPFEVTLPTGGQPPGQQPGLPPGRTGGGSAGGVGQDDLRVRAGVR